MAYLNQICYMTAKTAHRSLGCAHYIFYLYTVQKEDKKGF